MAHAPTVIWQKQAYVELLLDRDFFFQGCLVACEGNQTWKLAWVNQSVSSRQLSQVEEPDLCTAFTEPGGTVEEFSLLSFHQSKGTWEKMWEKGCWWGRVGRGQEEEKQSQRWKLDRTRAATVGRVQTRYDRSLRFKWRKLVQLSSLYDRPPLCFHWWKRKIIAFNKLRKKRLWLYFHSGSRGNDLCRNPSFPKHG